MAKKKAAAPRKRTARRVPTDAARAAGARLARGMPFVHFPANTAFTTWSIWGAIKSKTHRGESPPSSENFDVLRASHVFAYAGPCCFAEEDDPGDVAAYFDPAIDQTMTGSASPFDSGSLEGTDARLQDWAGKPLAMRWRFLQQHTTPLSGWRAAFEEWLLHCYDDPARYLDTQPDRYAAGEPDRTQPAKLRLHNGTAGKRKYGLGCADRRAWTWEARFEQPVPFSALRALHIPADRLQAVAEAASAQRFGTGNAPRIVPLPGSVASTPEELYLYSKDVIEGFL